MLFWLNAAITTKLNSTNFPTRESKNYLTICNIVILFKLSNDPQQFSIKYIIVNNLRIIYFQRISIFFKHMSVCVRCISNYLEIILCQRRKNNANNEYLKFEKFHKFIHEFIRETEFKIIKHETLFN